MNLLVPTAIVIAGGILKAPAEDFLKKLSGPAADELGSWLGDKAREFRARNAARIAARSQNMLAESGAEVHQVPLRTLLPLLEGASIEDSAELSELWAALLANAAATGGDSIPPIFSSILQQLTPFDARLLDQTAEVIASGLKEDPLPPRKERMRWGVSRNELDLVESFSDQMAVSIDTLVALGLLELEPATRVAAGSSILIRGIGEFRITALGRRFLNACTPPTLPGAASQRKL